MSTILASRKRRQLWIGAVAALVLGFALMLAVLSQDTQAAGANGPWESRPLAARGSHDSAGSDRSLNPWVLGSQTNVSRTGSLPSNYRAGELIVRYEPGTPAAQIRAADQAAGAASSQRLGKSVSGLYKVRLQQGVSIEAAIVAYSKQRGVAYAQPNYVWKVAATPDDPDFGQLWGLDNTGQNGGTADADIDAPEAWDTATDSSDVVVAVVDTGVDYTHPDLAANMWKNPGEIAGNGVDDDDNGYIDDIYGVDTVNKDSDPMDDYGHGTHCSGTIGAVGDNGVGVVGVNWNVKIMALKFLDASGYGSTEDAVLAIEYGAAMGADIFSCSWGGGPFDQVLYDAIANADKLFCFAAGNWSEDTDSFPNYPSGFDLPNIISVGASNRAEEMAWFSNYGRTTVDLFAPGDEILSTVPGGYEEHGGTSMATPHVAGTAALVLSENLGAGWDTLKLVLMGTAEPRAAYDGMCLSGARLNADLALDSASAAPGSITGTVTYDGSPVEGVHVSVDSTVFATTGADGTYIFSDIPPGTHTIVVSGGDFLTEVVPDIVVESGVTATADVTLRLSGKISGTVTAAKGGSALEGIAVTAYRFSEDGWWTPVGSTSTSGDGTYLITGLVTDSYLIEFMDVSGRYVAQYFDRADSLEEGTPVSVTEGAITSEIDGVLKEYGRITGKVTATAHGKPIGGIFVTAYLGDGYWWYPVAGAETREDGTYDLGGLTTGTYRLEYFDPSGEHAYEFFDDAPMVRQAADVTAVLGESTSGIDVALDPAAKISGRVRADGTGKPIPTAVAMVYRHNGQDWEPYVGAMTEPDGTYLIGGLRAGPYRVEFWDNNGVYAGEFYRDKSTLRSATAVGVYHQGMTLSGIDAGLALSGGLSGTVSDSATGDSLAWIGITLYSKVGSEWQPRDWTESAPDGTYSFRGLAPAKYKVEFYDYTGVYAPEFFDSRPTLAKATEIAVTAGANRRNVDAGLDTGGRISGTVTAADDGSPIPYVWVNVYQAVGSSWQWAAGAETGDDGSYAVGGLRTGKCKVEFYDQSGVYAWEFYNGQPTLAKANPVSVTLGNTTAGIDATLDRGGAISGAVTSVADRSPLAGIWAIVYRQISPGVWEPFNMGETDAGGQYTVGGLRTGSYKIRFEDPWGTYATEYYNNKASLRRADPVSVTAGATTPDINASLVVLPSDSSPVGSDLPASVLSPSERARHIRR